MDPITTGIIIIVALMVGGVSGMIFLWLSLKRDYAVNNHQVPLETRLGIFGIGCCTLAAPLYVLVYLISLS